MRPSPTLSTSDARRPFFALGDMDVILRHSQEALTDIDVLFVVRLFGKFRGTPEKVRWIRHGVLVEGMRGPNSERRARRTQRQNDNEGIPFRTNTILFSALRYRRTAMPLLQI